MSLKLCREPRARTCEDRATASAASSSVVGVTTVPASVRLPDQLEMPTLFTHQSVPHATRGGACARTSRSRGGEPCSGGGAVVPAAAVDDVLLLVRPGADEFVVVGEALHVGLRSTRGATPAQHVPLAPLLVVGVGLDQTPVHQCFRDEIRST